MSGKSREGKLQEVREALNEIWDLTKNRKIREQLSVASLAVDALVEEYEEELKSFREEIATEKGLFELRHRQLAGLAEEVAALARKKPESPCKAFKARQVNLVLAPLKDQMEADLDLSLSLVSEAEEHTYSDVSLVLRGYMDVSAAFAHRRFGLNYDVKGQEIPAHRFYGWGRR